MQKIKVKEIIEFRGKSDSSKKRFADKIKLKKEVKPPEEGGGDYWITSLSALRNTFKDSDVNHLVEKITELTGKSISSNKIISKNMYQRNINILQNFLDYEFKKLRPASKIKILPQHKDSQVLTLKGLNIQVSPHYVYSFEKGEDVEVGGIWFIAKLDGYKKSELGIFCELLYKYLKSNFSKEHIINPKYCLVLDVHNRTLINYNQLKTGDISLLLNPTLDDIKKFM